MPKKTVTKEPVVAAPVRAAKPRVRSVVKHSKATAAPVVNVVETVVANAHDQIAAIAYGYWEARGFQPGSPDHDWIRAEQEYRQRG